MFRQISRRFPRMAASVAFSAPIVGAGGVQMIFCSEEEKKVKKVATRRTSTLTASQADEFFSSQLVEAYRDYFKGNQEEFVETDLREILIGCGILDNHLVATFFHMLQLKEAENSKAKGAPKKKAKGKKDDLDLPDKISFKTFNDICLLLNQGEEAQKIDFIFDFVDITKRGMIDKYEMSTAVRHLLWCQTNWYGEEIVYSGNWDHDLYFEVPTEHVVQLKANVFAHEMVMKIPGGSRSVGITKKQFNQFMQRGGKEVNFLKGLFSVLGAYEPPEFKIPEE